MMYIKYFLTFLLSLSASTVLAFNCNLLLVKDSCWKNYQINVQVHDSEARKVLTTAIIPKDKQGIIQKFTCNPQQKLMFVAKFSPIFWQNQDGSYRAQKYLSLPSKVGEKEVAWNIKICFPREFSSVPFPPDAEGNCVCKFDELEASLQK